eukprot:1147341-Pleurochrysis_carterae.AAC.2
MPPKLRSSFQLGLGVFLTTELLNLRFPASLMITYDVSDSRRAADCSSEALSRSTSTKPRPAGLFAEA